MARYGDDLRFEVVNKYANRGSSILGFGSWYECAVNTAMNYEAMS
jgi:hypothetical protein